MNLSPLAASSPADVINRTDPILFNKAWRFVHDLQALHRELQQHYQGTSPSSSHGATAAQYIEPVAVDALVHQTVQLLKAQKEFRFVASILGIITRSPPT
jgi:hypothetical protein